MGNSRIENAQRVVLACYDPTGVALSPEDIVSRIAREGFSVHHCAWHDAPLRCVRIAEQQNTRIYPDDVPVIFQDVDV